MLYLSIVLWPVRFVFESIIWIPQDKYVDCAAKCWSHRLRAKTDFTKSLQTMIKSVHREAVPLWILRVARHRAATIRRWKEERGREFSAVCYSSSHTSHVLHHSIGSVRAGAPVPLMLGYAMLGNRCLVMPCYVAICYAMICSATPWLCHFMLCRPIGSPLHGEPMLCQTMPVLCMLLLTTGSPPSGNRVPGYSSLCYAMLCYLRYAMLCYALLCFATLSYAKFCHAMS